MKDSVKSIKLDREQQKLLDEFGIEFSSPGDDGGEPAMTPESKVKPPMSFGKV
mgnify:CR=1